MRLLVRFAFHLAYGLINGSGAGVKECERSITCEMSLSRLSIKRFATALEDFVGGKIPNLASVVDVRHNSIYRLFSNCWRNWPCGLLFLCSASLSSGADGLDLWHERNPAPSGDFFYECVYRRGTHVAIGAAGALFTSTNGITWTFQNLAISYPLHGVAYGADKFVVVGDRPVGNSVIWTSSDGIEWSARALASVTFGTGTYVAVGDGVVRSTNGTDWAYVGPSARTLSGVAYGSGLFVAVGEQGTLLVSTDGLQWGARPSGVRTTLFNIVYGTGKFVAVGLGGMITTSPDGFSWTPGKVDGVANELHGVTYGARHFVAVGTGGVIISSQDGQNWKKRASGTSEILSGISYSGWAFTAVGDKGTILQSDPIIALEEVRPATNGGFQFSFMAEARWRSPK